jgi:hypothetical protein
MIGHFVPPVRQTGSPENLSGRLSTPFISPRLTRSASLEKLDFTLLPIIENHRYLGIVQIGGGGVTAVARWLSMPFRQSEEGLIDPS